MNDFQLDNDVPAVLLAPMDGVTDRTMRELMGEVGGFTHMVTEFLRVSRMALPAKVIRRHMAETSTRSRTSHGIPVSLQLLGGHAGRLAETALTAVEVGVRGIDLNFGCPAPTVNRHDGGASLLRYPERIREIVTEVRRAVPRDIPVSVKMRLGWDDPTTLLRNAAEAIEGGASSIAIHGRTKAQGYAPPALWEPIGEVRKHSPIPIVANGDIWTFEDFLRCREETGCRHFMLGRSALADPHLAGRIGRHLGLASDDRPFPSDHEWRHLLTRFSELQESPNRLKQWLRLAHARNPIENFETLKRAGSLNEMRAHLAVMRFSSRSRFSGASTACASAPSTTPAS